MAKRKEPIVEVDEAALEARQKATEEFMARPEVIAEMEEGRLALEAELAAKNRFRPLPAALFKAQDEFDGDPDPDELVDFSASAKAEAVPEGMPEAPADEAVLPPPQVPVWQAKGQRAYPPEDVDDPFALGRITDVEVELFSDKWQYRLVVHEEGVVDQVWCGRERDGWGAALAMRRVKLDKDASYDGINKLPRVHPGEIERQRRLAKRFELQAGQVTPRPGRQTYADRCIVTGEVLGYSDGRASWAA